MSNYVPNQQHYDRMPVDISFVFKNERPAGKHGFVTIPEGKDSFYFEDGTPARFWGVIMNGAANFPEHDYAVKIARRLSQAGVNYVRFHQLDSEWATPNYYRVTAGERVVSTRELCPESMERLDFWIKTLKEFGIYACVDMCTYRKFKSGDQLTVTVTTQNNAPLMAENKRTLTFTEPTKAVYRCGMVTGIVCCEDGVWKPVPKRKKEKK